MLWFSWVDVSCQRSNAEEFYTEKIGRVQFSSYNNAEEAGIRITLTHDLAAGIIINTGLRRAMNTGILQRMEAEDKN
jgi:hypothetical protein